jgi:hypothetical protein
MLDLIGSTVGLMAIAVDLVAIATLLPLSLGQRLAVAAGVGAWVGLASGIGAAGLLQFAPNRPVPVIGLLIVMPLLTFAVLAIVSPAVRRGLLAIPMHVLIGLNSLRVLGALFLMLAAVGRLSGPFPFSAGLGDVLTGVLAIPLALAVARGGALPQRAVAGWNLFGALDLIAAIGLGVTSANGSPLHLPHGRRLRGGTAAALLPDTDDIGALLPDHPRRHRGTAGRRQTG